MKCWMYPINILNSSVLEHILTLKSLLWIPNANAKTRHVRLPLLYITDDLLSISSQLNKSHNQQTTVSVSQMKILINTRNSDHKIININVNFRGTWPDFPLTIWFRETRDGNYRRHGCVGWLRPPKTCLIKSHDIVILRINNKSFTCIINTEHWWLHSYIQINSIAIWL